MFRIQCVDGGLRRYLRTPKLPRLHKSLRFNSQQINNTDILIREAVKQEAISFAQTDSEGDRPKLLERKDRELLPMRVGFQRSFRNCLSLKRILRASFRDEKQHAVLILALWQRLATVWAWRGVAERRVFADRSRVWRLLLWQCYSGLGSAFISIVFWQQMWNWSKQHEVDEGIDDAVLWNRREPDRCFHV